MEEMEPHAQQLLRLATTKWHPSERRIYKPLQQGGGTALKIQLRIAPVFVSSTEGAEYIDQKASDGGLFLELVPQLGPVAKGQFARFDYQSDKRIISKLGLPDACALLIAYTTVREAHKAVPRPLRKVSKLDPDGSPDTASLFHQTPGGGNCVVTWQFSAENSVLRLSRSATHVQKITLTLIEELQFAKLLNRAIEAFLDTGL